MNELGFIKSGLYLQGLPAYDFDLPFIYDTLNTVNQAYQAIYKFPNLNQEVPITIVDKGLLKNG